MTEHQSLTPQDVTASEIAAWADKILSRERERRMRYLLSAVSHDQIAPRRCAGEGI